MAAQPYRALKRAIDSFPKRFRPCGCGWFDSLHSPQEAIARLPLPFLKKKPCALSQPLNRNLIALAAVLLVVPWFLSRKHRVVRRALVRARPADIFPLINDLRNWPRWTAWSQREEMHITYEGSPAGVGAVQTWRSRRMDGMLRIIQSVPDERIAYEAQMSEGRCVLDGIISLEPIGEFTRVTWICKWDGGSNPYAGYLNLFMRTMIGRDFAAGLSNLRALAEKAQS